MAAEAYAAVTAGWHTLATPCKPRNHGRPGACWSQLPRHPCPLVGKSVSSEWHLGPRSQTPGWERQFAKLCLASGSETEFRGSAFPNRSLGTRGSGQRIWFIIVELLHRCISLHGLHFVARIAHIAPHCRPVGYGANMQRCNDSPNKECRIGPTLVAVPGAGTVVTVGRR